MANYSLTLDNFKFANTDSFFRDYGTKKTSNGGSLTTTELNENMAFILDHQRPLTITENSVITNIQYDVRIFIKGVDLTLELQTATEGIIVILVASQKTAISFNNIVDYLLPGEQVRLIRLNDHWEIIQQPNKIIYCASDEKPFGTLPCNGSQYLKASYSRLAGLLKGIYNLSTDTEDKFRVPDLRELVLVGSGTSTRAEIATHNPLAVGQFQDDAMQGHSHSFYNSVGSININYHQSDKTAGGNDNISTQMLATISMSGRTDTTTHGKQFGAFVVITY